jgi:predicted nucleic acid-binding protein
VERLNLSKDRYYLDANTVLAILERKAPFSDRQKEFLSGIDFGKTDCASSELTLAECLVKPMRDSAAERMDAILSFLDDRRELPLLKFDRACFIRAAHIRAEAGLKMLDAMHVAIAEMAGCTVVVSADRNLRLPSPMKRVAFDDLSETAG